MGSGGSVWGGGARELECLQGRDGLHNNKTSPQQSKSRNHQPTAQGQQRPHPKVLLRRARFITATGQVKPTSTTP